MSSVLKSNVHQMNLTAVKASSPSSYEFEGFCLDAVHLMLYRGCQRLLPIND